MTVLITRAKNEFWLCCSGIWSLKNMQASCLQQYKCNFNNNFSSVLCNRFFVQWHLKGTLFLLEEELNILLSVAVIIVLPAGCWKKAAPCVYLPISASFSQKRVLPWVVGGPKAGCESTDSCCCLTPRFPGSWLTAHPGCVSCSRGSDGASPTLWYLLSSPGLVLGRMKLRLHQLHSGDQMK